MKKQTALMIVMILAIAGIAFSGYLSYTEIFKQYCALGSCTQVSGIPACVYGLGMYIVVLVFSILGLKSKEN